MTRIQYDSWTVKFAVDKEPSVPKYEIGQTVHREHHPDQAMRVVSRKFEITFEHRQAETYDQEDGCLCVFFGAWNYTCEYLSHVHTAIYEERDLCLGRQGAEKYYIWRRMSESPEVAISSTAPIFPKESLTEIVTEYEAVHFCTVINQSDAMFTHYAKKWSAEK